MNHDLRYLYQITSADLDTALASLTSKAAHHTEAQTILRAIKTRSGLIGRVLNKSSVPALEAALTGYRVTYSINEYSKDRLRYVVVAPLNEQGESVYRLRHEFALATASAPRLTVETIDERITYHREQAQKYARLAADLPALVAAYNAAAAYLMPIKNELETALIYAA